MKTSLKHLQYYAIADTIDIATNKPANKLDVIYRYGNYILRPVSTTRQYSCYREPPILTCTKLL